MGLINFTIGCFLGFIIWSISPIVTGEIEPWDAQGTAIYYYPLTLFLSGFLGSLFYPKSFKATAYGVFVGQVLFLLSLGLAPLFLVGIIQLAFCSLIALLGGWLAWQVQKYLNRKKSRKDKSSALESRN
jgi:hypothetical protein